MTTIYGASDDIVCFSGEFNDEAYPKNELPLLVVCSDGTIVSLEYSPPGRDGIWQAVLIKKGSLFSTFEPAGDPDGPDYSDKVVLSDGIKWIYAAQNWVEIK